MIITKSGSKLTIGAMNYNGNIIAESIFDLKDHKGERIRVHIDTSGKYTVETKPRQELLICELDIPERRYIHTQKIVNGETVVESSEKELKLGEITMKEYVKEVVEK
jgi:hypothetical protein